MPVLIVLGLALCAWMFGLWMTGSFKKRPTIEEMRAALSEDDRREVDALVMDVWSRHPIHLLPIEEKQQWYTPEFAADARRINQGRRDAQVALRAYLKATL